MKRDRIKTLLLAEALICALLALALWLFEGDAFSLAGFPGSAIGPGLSALRELDMVVKGGYRIDKPQIKKMDEVERELDKFL